MFTWRLEIKPSDLESVRLITQSSGFFSPEEVSVAIELVAERLNKEIGSGYHFIFAELDGQTVGYVCFGPIACTQSSYDLYWIAVHEKMRMRGLGKQLMERTEHMIAEQGGTRVYVDTSSRAQYEPTREFYAGRGYRIEAVLKDFYAPGDDKVVFVKAIAPSVPLDCQGQAHSPETGNPKRETGTTV